MKKNLPLVCEYCRETIDDIAVVVKIDGVDFYSHPRCDARRHGRVLDPNLIYPGRDDSFTFPEEN